MDIILNTIFNNPTLPTEPVPGFYDDFTGGGGGYDTLGVTHENKPWDYMGGEGWYQRGADNTATGAGLVNDQVRSALAVVDGGKSDGTLTTHLAKASIQDPRYGPAFRVTDSSNYLYVSQGSTGNGIRIYETIDGQANWIEQTPDTSFNDGDTIQVQFQDNNIAVLINGRPVIAAQSTHNLNATHHGFFNWSSAVTGLANPRWDWIRFE